MRDDDVDVDRGDEGAKAPLSGRTAARVNRENCFMLNCTTVICVLMNRSATKRSARHSVEAPSHESVKLVTKTWKQNSSANRPRRSKLTLNYKRKNSNIEVLTLSPRVYLNLTSARSHKSQNPIRRRTPRHTTTRPNKHHERRSTPFLSPRLPIFCSRWQCSSCYC